MNYEIAAAIAIVVASVASFFFWVRGMIKGRKDDLLAGFALFVVLCLLLGWLGLPTASFAHMGELMMTFGALTIVTVIISFIRKGNPLPKWQRSLFGLGAIPLVVFGYLVGMIT